MPDLTKAKAMKHLMISMLLTTASIHVTFMLVNLLRQNASGTTMTHVYTLSKSTVIRAFPPDLMMKYDACVYEQKGIMTADIRMNTVARCLM